MIKEQKQLFEKIEESLTNHSDEWVVSKPNHDYIIENKFNKFKIVRDRDDDYTTLKVPDEVSLGRFFSNRSLCKKIKQCCKKFDHDNLVNKYITLNELFDTRTVLILNVDRYRISLPKSIFNEDNLKGRLMRKVTVKKFYSCLKKEMTGKVKFIEYGSICYLYFEKEKDMSFVILKYSDYLIM